MVIPLIHQNKRCYIGNQIQLAVIFSPPKAGKQYERTAILYHQQYISKLGDKGILQWCAKGIVIFFYIFAPQFLVSPNNLPKGQLLRKMPIFRDFYELCRIVELCFMLTKKHSEICRLKTCLKNGIILIVLN